MLPTSRILFAGGCMVTGYPVGAELSLSNVALRSLGCRASEGPRILPYINLSSGPGLEDACREQETEFLVLQLGDYETIRPFSKVVTGHRACSEGSQNRAPAFRPGAEQAVSADIAESPVQRPRIHAGPHACRAGAETENL